MLAALLKKIRKTYHLKALHFKSFYVEIVFRPNFGLHLGFQPSIYFLAFQVFHWQQLKQKFVTKLNSWKI